jgi:hypothetical protein
MPMQCCNTDKAIDRRDFLSRFGLGLGAFALGTLLNPETARATSDPFRGILDQPHFPARARRIIYLFMSGGPSQHDLFDYKPLLNKMNGEELPASVRGSQRLTGMSANQARLPLAGSLFKFAQHRKSGTWFSELIPWTAKIADELFVVR